MQEIRKAIDICLASRKDQPVIVAIDGRAAAGKTTLARAIAEQYDCNVFHMDDFFLPPAMRTAERLAEAGGNVHYERFRTEVLLPLGEGKPFDYGVFDCSVMAVNERRSVMPKVLNVIEGSYSHHPAFGDAYDLRIFLTVSGEEQMERILRRNGAEKAEMFRSRWIPMEERYFAAHDVMGKSHMVIFG